MGKPYRVLERGTGLVHRRERIQRDRMTVFTLCDREITLVLYEEKPRNTPVTCLVCAAAPAAAGPL